MITYHFDYLKPSVVALTMYCQSLANSFQAPRKTRNHLSGVKNWILLHGGLIQSFSALELNMMKKAITEKSGYIPSPARSLTPADIRTICDYVVNLRQHKMKED